MSVPDDILIDSTWLVRHILSLCYAMVSNNTFFFFTVEIYLLFTRFILSLHHVQGDIEMGGNGTLTVESGGTLIIDGAKLSNAKLDLKPGATLRIINNGTIETRNGFTAPVGATVEISHGKIL